MQRPAWYEALGSTDEERQEAYRLECERYRSADLLPSEGEAEQSHMIGPAQIVSKRNSLMRTISRLISRDMLIRQELNGLVAAALKPDCWSTLERGDTAVMMFQAAVAAIEGRQEAPRPAGRQVK